MNIELATLKRLAFGFEVPLSRLLTHPEDDHAPAAPAIELDAGDYRVLGLSKRAGAGGPVINHDDEDALRLAFRADWLRQLCGTAEITEDRAFLVEVAGDSMEPTIMDGAVVLAHRWRPTPTFENGAIYVLKEKPTANESGLIVKRLTLDRAIEGLIVASDNAAYGPYVLPIRGEQLQDIVMGRVFWVSQRIESRPGARGAIALAKDLARKPGRPRNMRRKPDLGDPFYYDEDAPADGREEV